MGETEEDGAKPLRQPKKDGSQKPIRQAENEIPVFALSAILANMDARTMSELIAKKKILWDKFSSACWGHARLRGP